MSVDFKSSTVALTQQLVALPSVNPRLSSNEAIAGERRVTDWLEQYCRDRGWKWLRQPVHEGRDNLLAQVPGGVGAPLLWEAHQDTVAVDGMTIDPFGGQVREGRLYGRGACDVKGAMAALLAAATKLAELPSAQRAPLWLAFTVNEECGFTGATELARLWSRSSQEASTLRQRCRGTLELDAAEPPAAAIVCEPTDLDVVIAHRGVVRWQCFAEGRAVHSSNPQAGANAVYAMAEAVRALRGYATETLAARTPDRWCGAPTLCVTTFHGGRGPNTVPDLAVIDVDRRLSPEEDPDEAYREAVAFTAAALVDYDGCRIRHDPPWLASAGLDGGANQAWGERLSSVVQRVGGAGRIVGVPYGTNAARLAALGIPVAVLGPGSIAQAHTADEWIDVDELARGADALYRLGQELAG